jgi:hypothetical protein
MKACHGQALQIQAEHPIARQNQTDKAGTKHVLYSKCGPAEGRLYKCKPSTRCYARPRHTKQEPNTVCIGNESLPQAGFTNTSRAPEATPDPGGGCRHQPRLSLRGTAGRAQTEDADTKHVLFKKGEPAEGRLYKYKPSTRTYKPSTRWHASTKHVLY